LLPSFIHSTRVTHADRDVLADTLYTLLATLAFFAAPHIQGMFWAICFAAASFRAAPNLNLGVDLPSMGIRL
jgi:hypothetical protein